MFRRILISHFKNSQNNEIKFTLYIRQFFYYLTLFTYLYTRLSLKMMLAKNVAICLLVEYSKESVSSKRFSKISRNLEVYHISVILSFHLNKYVVFLLVSNILRVLISRKYLLQTNPNENSIKTYNKINYIRFILYYYKKK